MLVLTSELHPWLLLTLDTSERAREAGLLTPANSFSTMVLLISMRTILLIACFLLTTLALTSNDVELREVERIKRTIGGTSFNRGHWPWLALMRATIVTSRLFGLFAIRHRHLYCGAVLISNRWLLSAAHCFRDYGRSAGHASNWEARLGTTRLRAGIREHIRDLIGQVIDADELRNWEVDVDRLVIHPQYNTTGLYSNDIALIKLSRSVPISSRFSLIRPISLPDDNETNFPSPGETCITKGWGCTSRGGGPSEEANQISMPINPASQCHNLYRLPMDNRICAGHFNNGVGVCPGDSGSPLVCRRGNSYKLAGIVSLTSRRRPGNFPAIFTSVKEYLPWIRHVMSRY